MAEDIARVGRGSEGDLRAFGIGASAIHRTGASGIHVRGDGVFHRCGFLLDAHVIDVPTVGISTSVYESKLDFLATIVGEVDLYRLPFIRSRLLAPHFSYTITNHRNAFILIVIWITFIGLEGQLDGTAFRDSDARTGEPAFLLFIFRSIIMPSVVVACRDRNAISGVLSTSVPIGQSVFVVIVIVFHCPAGPVGRTRLEAFEIRQGAGFTVGALWLGNVEAGNPFTVGGVIEQLAVFPNHADRSLRASTINAI